MVRRGEPLKHSGSRHHRSAWRQADQFLGEHQSGHRNGKSAGLQPLHRSPRPLIAQRPVRRLAGSGQTPSLAYGERRHSRCSNRSQRLVARNPPSARPSTTSQRETHFKDCYRIGPTAAVDPLLSFAAANSTPQCGRSNECRAALRRELGRGSARHRPAPPRSMRPNVCDVSWSHGGLHLRCSRR